MASMFLRPMLRPNTLGVGLGLSMSTFAVYRQNPMKLESKRLFSETQQTAAHKPAKRNVFLNPSSVKQISSGSVFGIVPIASVPLWTTSDEGARTMRWTGCQHLLTASCAIDRVISRWHSGSSGSQGLQTLI